jgi:flagellar biosynthesis protein FlhG
MSLDQAAPLRARIAGRQCQIIAVTSGKGGVGKTSLVANLGVELARAGRCVLMVDGDLGLANLAILFNVAPRADLSDVVAGRARVGDVVLTLGENLRLIPAAGGMAALADLDEARRRELLAEILTLAGSADFVLIDTGAGISATVLALVLAADRTFVVTTHEPTALADAYALIKCARLRGAHEIDVIVNLATTQAEARATHERLARLCERFLDFAPPLAAVIPRDACVGEAVTRQQPLTVIYPWAPATRAIGAFARVLAASSEARYERARVSLAVQVSR